MTLWLSDFYFGDSLTPKLANFDRNVGETTDVGIYNKPNAFGLYDMHGNVWEWCADNDFYNYENAPSDGSVWTDLNSIAYVMRGGSFLLPPYFCRSAYRHINNTDYCEFDVGFRIVYARVRAL
jgi:formylglycine-generating enzyme required for sulfatase activity